jgi:site-specific recombinase XerD
VASIFKRMRSFPIPGGAEIIERRRKATAAELREDPQRRTIVERFAIWTDGKTGRARKAPLNTEDNAILVEARHYTIAYFDADGIRRTKNSKTPDLQTAERIAGRIEDKVAQQLGGLIDGKAERYARESRRPIAEHLAEFKQNLRDKGGTAKHVDLLVSRLERLLNDAKIQHIGDMTDAAVMGAIGELKDEGLSLQTCTHYIRAAKQFSKWLQTQKRTPDDPLRSLSGFNAETDRRYIRREMTPEELARLLATVETYTTAMHNLPGPDRVMAYRVALGTGFRSKELRSLTRESFNLDSETPTVTVQAAYSKRRRLDVQPIRQDLADILRPWLAEYEADARPFANLPERTARMLRDDLDEARRRWLDEAETDAQRQEREASDFLKHTDKAGRVADFHGLRVAYISALVAGGASVKTAQELARHSTPALTIGRYSHTRLHDIRGALDSLPSLQPQAPELDNQALQSTGTDGGDGSKMAAYRQQWSDESTRKTAKPRNRPEVCSGPRSGSEARLTDNANVLPFQDLAKPRGQAAGSCKADGEGFEPPVGFLPQRFSRPPP